MDFKGSLFTPLRIGRTAIAIGVAFAAICTLGTAVSTAAELTPQTKFRLKVVQWVPVKSAYEEWGALGGEFTISSNGNIALPVVGPISTTGMDSQGFAEEVATRLQKKTGLVNKPEVSVQIVEYPPVYVAGDVSTPGEYRFREGMTVMQAIAVAGGERRSVDDAVTTVRLLSDFKSGGDEIVRITARIARLQAELDGAAEIVFPDIPEIDALGASDEIFARERILFEARNEELERQEKSLSDLRDLFHQEISVLEQKRASSEQGLESARKELEGVSKLVDKGFAVASRKSEMERIVTGYKSDSLDQTTAIMRARQGAAEATRNLDSLQDRRRSEAAAQMQDAKAALEQAKLRRATTQRLLVGSISSTTPDGASQASLSFNIIRVVDGKPTQIDATETTLLMPGDVVNASFKMPAESRDQASLGKAAPGASPSANP